MVWADCDSPEAIAALEAFPLTPSMIVRSGSGENAHAYWFLSEPVDLDGVERLNKRIAVTLGGDKVHDAARILRVPGTLNHKHEPPTEVVLVTSSDTRYAVAEIEAAAPKIPAAAGTRAAGTGVDHTAEDVSPTARVLALLDDVRQSGNGWKARCPAHDDQNPSLSVAEGQDGSCLVHCHANCAPQAVAEALGLSMAELFPYDGSGGKSLSEMLVGIAEDAGVELFHDSAGIAYARVPVAEHHEVWTVASRRFKRWLRFELRHQFGRMAKADAVNEAVELLSALADFDGEEMEVSLRSSWMPGGFIYNLDGPAGQIVTVTSEGWTVGLDRAATFLRRESVQALPTPVPGGSLDLLRPYVNTESEEDFMLIVSWLLMALRPAGPYPVLVVQGQQGSAKSTLSRVLKALVDPVKAPVRSLPGSLRDLAITAASNWVLVIDNLSTLKDGMSDAFCRLATGGGFATRALYTDDEERIFDQSRATILNGTDAIVTRQDLLGRSIVIRLPKIAESARVDEATFWADFEADRAKILGALLDAASVGLARWDTTHVRGLRMADFARWAAAATHAFGWDQDALITAYEDNLSGALKASLEGSVLATVVIRLLMERGNEPIEGPPTAVRQTLHGGLSDDEIKSGLFPKNAQSMSRALTLLTPALAEVGIEVVTITQGSGSNKSRWIVVRAAGDRDPRDARDERDAESAHSGDAPRPTG